MSDQATSSAVAAADPQTAALVAASKGFDLLFANRVAEARVQLAREASPFHLLGLGVCAFLEAALGMETNLMGEAARCLAESEAAAKRQKQSKDKVAAAARASAKGNVNFPPGIEYEILQADAVVLQGLVHALSESYMGYSGSSRYSLNRYIPPVFTSLLPSSPHAPRTQSAHSRFTKLYKTIFPTGLDAYVTPAASPAPSRFPSEASSLNSSRASVNTLPAPPSSSSSSSPAPSPRGSYFLSKLGLGTGAGAGTGSYEGIAPKLAVQPEGPVEELIVSGAAFGFGLFNLVFSLLPGKVKSVVGFLGFQHNRRLALQALAVSAAREDVHSVFAGLVLMSYYGVVLLLSGFQADEKHIDKQYRAIVDRVSTKYPDGALWILNRAKIARMTYDPDGAIRILQDGLKPGRPGMFPQADALLIFELAWTLLSQRRYEEAAETFLRMTEVNSWSHATYYTIAAGCFVSLNNRARAKELLDRVPALLDKKKIGGKELPTEVFIKKKLAFYKAKAKRRGADESAYVEYIKISPAEELGVFWNTHQRITKETALAHVAQLSSLTPPISTPSSFIPQRSALAQASTPAPNSSSSQPRPPDLDTPDELAIRALILGILHRTLRDFKSARAFLGEAFGMYEAVGENKWVGGVALFELAVLEVKEVEAREQSSESILEGRSASSNDDDNVFESGGKPTPAEWNRALKEAGAKLEKAMAISGSSVDLSSRLDTRVNMLKDEIAIKREMLGL